MSRRDTILVAVLINAGLLLILFATAIDPKKREPKPSLPVASSAEKKIEQVTPEVKKEEPKLPESVAVVKDPLEEISLIASSAQKEKPFESVSVKRGDSLDKLARKYDTTVETLVELNELESSLLSIGQVLRVPTKPGFRLEKNENKQIAENTTRSVRREYTVQSGDSPWLISRKNGVDLHELLEINDLDTESAKRLKPGMKLILPE